MKQIMRKGQVPPSGHHFFQGGTKITGHSKANVIDNIGKFRVANQLDYGNPQEDYEAYICSRWPSHCIPSYTEREAEKLDIEVAEAKESRTNLEEVRLASKLFAYSRGTRWKDLEQKETATTRSATCESCPENRAYSALTHCHSCIEEIQRQATMLTEAKKLDRPLGWCGATLGDLRSMVFLPKEGLERQLKRAEVTPGFCWLRNLK